MPWPQEASWNLQPSQHWAVYLCSLWNCSICKHWFSPFWVIAEKNLFPCGLHGRFLVERQAPAALHKFPQFGQVDWTSKSSLLFIPGESRLAWRLRAFWDAANLLAPASIPAMFTVKEFSYLNFITSAWIPPPRIQASSKLPRILDITS